MLKSVMYKLMIENTCGGKNMCGTDMDDFSVSTKNSSNIQILILIYYNDNQTTVTFSSFGREWWIHVSTMNLIILVFLDVDIGSDIYLQSGKSSSSAL